MDDRPRILAGRYEMGDVIGRGGMGTVFEAVDLRLERSVAVKVLPGHLADRDVTSVARFEREARAAAALSHPGVVAVYDTGVDGTTRFIVMELISGQSLEATVRDQGSLDPRHAIGIISRVADALAAAHAAGIVHRDIKPANVMIAADGSVKVLDFGIARAVDSTTLTLDSSVLGTAAYMSPEQALGHPVDERSDIYSLGCVLYALLAGQPPFRGESVAAILNQHANVPPAPPDAGGAKVAAELGALVLQMLAKAPRDRPQTAGEVRDRLMRQSARLDDGSRLTAATQPMTRTLPQPPRSSPAGPDPRRMIVPAALAAAALVILVLVSAAGGGAPRSPTRASHRITAATGRSTTRASRSTTSSAPAAPRSGTTSQSTSQSTPTTTSAPPAGNVAQPASSAAGALISLSAQDLRSGAIDQQTAQQITNVVSGILSNYEQGHTTGVAHKLSDLSQRLAQLQQHGNIGTAAALGLEQAIAGLGSALAAEPAPPNQPNQPPGHGGQPPGQAKHDEAQGD